MVVQLVMRKGNYEELDEEEDFVRDLYRHCLVEQNKKVPVDQTRDLFGRVQGDTEDYPGQIALPAVMRYFPGTFQAPYDLIDRVVYFDSNRFALFTLNPEVLVADIRDSSSEGESTNESDATTRSALHDAARDLDSFDYTKYYEVYSFATGQSEEKRFGEVRLVASKPMVWLEILCVGQQDRKKGAGKRFLEEIFEMLQQLFPRADEIIVGVDVPGTRNRYVNTRLREFYEGVGFTLQRMPGSGSLIGFLTL